MASVRPRSALRELVAAACRILHNEGQEHFYLGHVSAREEGSDLICVKPAGLGLGEVTADDLIVLDLDGRKIDGDRPAHHEMPIHTQIYKGRPDVTCVVHTHPFYAAAFSATTAAFQMVSADSVLFAGGVGLYPSPVLVVSTEQGQKVAECLGDRSVVVLKNHGIAVAAGSVQHAAFLAVSFDRSLRLQLAAQQFGPLAPISAEEVREMNDYFDARYEGRIEVTWQYLRRRARLEEGDEHRRR